MMDWQRCWAYSCSSGQPQCSSCTGPLFRSRRSSLALRKAKSAKALGVDGDQAEGGLVVAAVEQHGGALGGVGDTPPWPADRAVRKVSRRAVVARHRLAPPRAGTPGAKGRRGPVNPGHSGGML
jgi:hypothetical protein